MRALLQHNITHQTSRSYSVYCPYIISVMSKYDWTVNYQTLGDSLLLKFRF